jgi:hypothetical protein
MSRSARCPNVARPVGVWSHLPPKSAGKMHERPFRETKKALAKKKKGTSEEVPLRATIAGLKFTDLLHLFLKSPGFFHSRSNGRRPLSYRESSHLPSAAAGYPAKFSAASAPRKTSTTSSA